MPRRQRSIFVLNALGGAKFAFEADSLEAAEALCRTAWFMRAVDRYFSANRKEGTDGTACGMTCRTRTATDAEASSYWQVADEFAELPDCLLLARLSECGSVI